MNVMTDEWICWICLGLHSARLDLKVTLPHINWVKNLRSIFTKDKWRILFITIRSLNSVTQLGVLDIKNVRERWGRVTSDSKKVKF